MAMDFAWSRIILDGWVAYIEYIDDRVIYKRNFLQPDIEGVNTPLIENIRMKAK